MEWVEWGGAGEELWGFEVRNWRVWGWCQEIGDLVGWGEGDVEFRG